MPPIVNACEVTYSIRTSEEKPCRLATGAVIAFGNRMATGYRILRPVSSYGHRAKEGGRLLDSWPWQFDGGLRLAKRGVPRLFLCKALMAKEFLDAILVGVSGAICPTVAPRFCPSKREEAIRSNESQFGR